MPRNLILAALVLASVAGGLVAAEAATYLPKEGQILKKGQRLMCWRDDQVRLSTSIATNPIPPIKAIRQKGTGDPLKFEYERQKRRDRELEGLQMGTVGKGVLTEVIYGKGREKMEKNTATGKKRSLLESLFH
jgi:hypothetical protein